jgi:hypothetical protein
MDFAYEVDTFDNENLVRSQSKGMTLKLSSLSTSDFTKKLQSLSILDIAKSSNNNINSYIIKNENIPSLITSQALKRAKTSIDLLDSLGFDYNIYHESIKNENDDIADIILNNSNFDGKLLLNKLSKILKTSDGYDLSIKNSLATLENRIQYEISLDKSNNSDISLSENLKFLTSTGQQGNLARRNLRGLIENDLLQQYSSQLRNFSKIVKLLESIRPNLQTIQDKYNALSNSIDKSIDDSKDLKNEISDFDHQKKLIDLKKNILLAFKSTFTISQYEEHLIRFADLNDSTTGIEFFSTIDKINSIQNNCDVLLGMENEKLGLNILKQMNELLISVNERINSFVKNNIDYVYSGNTILNKNTNIDIFQKCLIYLYEHNKSNFDLIMSDMIEHRSRTIANEFLNQLKGYTEEISSKSISNPSSPNLTRKSIQSYPQSQQNLFMSSYDTNRFISDTLAYIHSLLVNEIENSKSFFTFDFISKNENNGLENMINGVVNKIVSGLNNSLKGSIESILRQESKLTTIVNSYELIDLYSNMYEKLLYPKKSENDLDLNNNDKTSILNTMKYLEKEAQERIFLLINLKLKNLQIESQDEGLNTIDDGDVVPDWIVEWCGFIDELFKTYSSNKNLDIDELHIIGLDDKQWDDLLNLLINKPIDIINDVKMNSKVDKKEKIIWGLNCIDYFFNKVDINQLLTTKANDLQLLIDEETDKLIELEFNGLLENSGLFDVFNLINMIFKLDDEYFDVAYYQPILENKLFNIETFKKADSKLEHFLSTYINQNELNGLMSPRLFNKVFFESSMKFIEFYKKLCLIVNEYLRDENEKTIQVFQWDAITIATLLGVEEYYQEHHK